MDACAPTSCSFEQYSRVMGDNEPPAVRPGQHEVEESTPISVPTESATSRQSLALTCVLVREYEEAIAFYVGVMGFSLVEDSPIPSQNKRWVVVSPPGAAESRLLLARAASPEQEARIGNQTGGRVFLFLHTDDFWRDFKSLSAKGVCFIRPPTEEPHGTVAVFRDGNLWDLIQPRKGAP
jgi:catechol 2,3-dioxygenase-like lactoylglutathione lyase family enzyme